MLATTYIYYFTLAAIHIFVVVFVLQVPAIHAHV